MRLMPLALIGFLPLVTACAAGPAPVTDASPPQVALVKAACTRIMHLWPGEAQWVGCVSDLSEMVSYQNKNQQVIDSYGVCRAQGLKHGSAEFSTCVLDHENDIAPSRPAFMDASLVKPYDNDIRSYYVVSFDLRRRREEYACAAIGFEPGSASFGTCIGNLDSDLFNISIPNG